MPSSEISFESRNCVGFCGVYGGGGGGGGVGFGFGNGGVEIAALGRMGLGERFGVGLAIRIGDNFDSDGLGTENWGSETIGVGTVSGAGLLDGIGVQLAGSDGIGGGVGVGAEIEVGVGVGLSSTGTNALGHFVISNSLGGIPGSESILRLGEDSRFSVWHAETTPSEALLNQQNTHHFQRSCRSQFFCRGLHQHRLGKS